MASNSKSIKNYQESSRKPGIYKVTCKFNGKFYIGSCACFKDRWYSHERLLRNGNHPNGKLQNCYNKYGEESLVWEILEIIPDSTMLQRTEREQHYLNLLWCESILNLQSVTGKFNYKRSETNELRKNMSERMKGDKNPMYGKPISDEMRAILRKTASTNANCIANQFKKGEPSPFRGKQSPFKGQKRSQEICDKISESKKEAWKKKKEGLTPPSETQTFS